MYSGSKVIPNKVKLVAKSYLPLSRLHIDFVGPLNGSHHFIVVDSFSDWLEILKSRKPTAQVAINFLHEVFAWYGLPDEIILDNASRFTDTIKRAQKKIRCE